MSAASWVWWILQGSFYHACLSWHSPSMTFLHQRIAEYGVHLSKNPFWTQRGNSVQRLYWPSTDQARKLWCLLMIHHSGWEVLIGLDFTRPTDHKPLITLLKSRALDDLSPWTLRFRLRLLRFSFNTIHIPANYLITVDTLSKVPFPTFPSHRGWAGATEVV